VAVLTASVVLHVAAGALWTGATLQFAFATLRPARAGRLGREAFVAGLDDLLTTTRWTGLVLPLTGAYQAWALYDLAALFGTPRGHLVLAMAALWGAMNGVIELGVLRVRRAVDPVGPVAYLREGFPVDALPAGAADGPDAAGLAATARPYVLAAAGLAALLLVDAGLLAAGGW